MSSLAQRLIKAAPKSMATMISKTDIGVKSKIASFVIPLMNLMYSGSFQGGLCAGIVQLVGDSRTFKTNKAVTAAKAYLDTNANPDNPPILVIFDSEFSIRPVIEAFGISEDQVVYVPFENLEELKTNLVQMISEVKRGEKVFFLIDSISQVASLKEVADALKGESKADMTRAKEMNSMFRMITPMLAVRDLPLFAINSFYDEIGNDYAEPVIKGGKQNFLSSDIIWFVSRSQDKDDTSKELKGWFFNYRALKHRFVKEKSLFKLHVTYDGGIDWSSGLIELGIESGIIKSSGGWFKLDHPNTPEELKKSFQRRQVVAKGDTGFLEFLLSLPEFEAFCQNKYRLADEDREIISQELTEESKQ
ncbi:RecA-like recombination protein [Acinetobacter phage SH-Ab 15599]|nr:RecA-like recombination protein [Acinetobacter phage SH-Ab 15599]